MGGGRRQVPWGFVGCGEDRGLLNNQGSDLPCLKGLLWLLVENGLQRGRVEARRQGETLHTGPGCSGCGFTWVVGSRR